MKRLFTHHHFLPPHGQHFLFRRGRVTRHLLQPIPRNIQSASVKP